MPRRKIQHELEVATGVVVRLRHTTRQGNWRFYHYEGELPVVDSVLTIPANLPEVIKRAWIQGFRMTAGGRVIADLAKHIRAETEGASEEEPEAKLCCSDECCQPETEELSALCCADEECCADDAGADCACTPVVETETAESGEENDTDEGAADRGQSPDDDGVRASEPDRDGSLPEGGDDGRVGDEPADGGEGDEPAD